MLPQKLLLRKLQQLMAEVLAEVDTRATKEVSWTAIFIFKCPTLEYMVPIQLVLIPRVSAFRDRTAGSANNRGKPVDDGAREDRPQRTRGTYEGRGGRGTRGERQMDRHSRTVGG
jgi:hypothetical protein